VPTHDTRAAENSRPRAVSQPAVLPTFHGIRCVVASTVPAWYCSSLVLFQPSQWPAVQQDTPLTCHVPRLQSAPEWLRHVCQTLQGCRPWDCLRNVSSCAEQQWWCIALLLGSMAHLPSTTSPCPGPISRDAAGRVGSCTLCGMMPLLHGHMHVPLCFVCVYSAELNAIHPKGLHIIATASWLACCQPARREFNQRCGRHAEGIPKQAAHSFHGWRRTRSRPCSSYAAEYCQLCTCRIGTCAVQSASIQYFSISALLFGGAAMMERIDHMTDRVTLQ
jgi:hypothetical protein